MGIGEVTKPNRELGARCLSALAVARKIESRHQAGAVRAVAAMHQEGFGGLFNPIQNSSRLLWGHRCARRQGDVLVFNAILQGHGELVAVPLFSGVGATQVEDA